MIKYLLHTYKAISLKREEDGFTLVELIASSAISIAVLISAYSLINKLFVSNKSDELKMLLSRNVDNSLDYLMDEINSGNRLLTKPIQYPKHCNVPKGDFVIGIKLPIQALKVEAYSSDYSNTKVWKEVDCPITYSLIEDTKNNIRTNNYKLLRRGPMVNKDGFYVANKISNSEILDGVSSNPKINITCSEDGDWERRKVRGIIICTDKYRRAAQVSITAGKLLPYEKSFSIIRTSGSTNRVIDNELINNDINISKEIDPIFDPYLDPIHGDKCEKFRSSMVHYSGTRGRNHFRLETGCYGHNGKWLPDPCANSKYPQGCFPYSFKTSQGWFPCVSGNKKYFFKVPKGHPQVSSRNCKTYIPGVSF